MSLLIHGPNDLSFKLCSFMLNYPKLCNNEIIDLINIEEKSFPIGLTVKNKYYIANLALKFIELFDEISKTSDTLDEFEGMILIQSPLKPILNSDLYRLGNFANEKDLSLRLLIKFSGLQDQNSEDDLYWAVDNGFELIEIDENSLLESFNSRDKLGLPRLMEALEANMWSTAEREKKNEIDSKLDIPHANVEEPIKGIRHEENMVEFYQNLENDDDDDDDDMELFNNFAAAMSQAKEIRERALGGNISDEERRNQAADMMLKLAKILKLDDDDDVADNEN